VPRAVVDTAVLRVLRLKFALGLFEQPYAGEPATVDVAAESAAHALAREAAEASLVLLRNERGVLPLGASVRRIAIIGEDALSLPSGGYSARLLRPVSLVDAVRRRLGAQGMVRHAPGPRRDDWPWAVLDTDDTTSFGPEITTLALCLAGTYRYTVHNYSGSPGIETSQAKGYLTLPDGSSQTVDVPTSNASAGKLIEAVVAELTVQD